jgi:acyl-CoA synthetase (AMP-forming)/AMP-acid ligase II
VIVNILMVLDMAAEAFPDRVVFGSRHGGDAVTAAQLRAASESGAELLRSQHAPALVYLGTNGVTFPVAVFSAARAGVAFIPLNYRLGPTQLASLLDRHRGAVAVVPDGLVEMVRRSGLHACTLAQFRQLSEATEPARPRTTPDSKAGAAVTIYTSGSTSAPKAVLLAHSHLVSYLLTSVDFASAESEDAALVGVPPYHIAGVANVLSNLFAGRRVVSLENFDPAAWLEMARAEGVTNALVVPTMLARIMEQPAQMLAVPTLRTLAYGGAPTPTKVIERALTVWPGVDFVNAYGLTETSSTVAMLGPEDHRAAWASSDPIVRARLGSAGRALPAIELEIRDAAGTVLEACSRGRVWVRGDQVSGAYAESGRLLDDRGFFDTRDEGWIDSEDYLFIAGRADDTIIRGGENIAPAEVEAVLLEHPAVIDAVVVGVADEEWGQRLEAGVVLRGEATVDEEALRGYVRRVLRGSKTPDRFHFWDAVPRTDSGKVDRRAALRLASPVRD